MTNEVLVYTRVFDAPRELVFDCLTEPHHLTHFWGPSGVSAPLDDIEVDLRPGGRFRTVMVGEDGSRYPTEAVYVDIRPPELLSWNETHSDMFVAATFTELPDGRTELRIEQHHAPESARSPQARAGFVTSLDKFAEYLRRHHPLQKGNTP